MTAPYSVFISYSSKDAGVAQVACTSLEKQGIRCWIAPRDIRKGREWADEIILGIEACRVMLLIFSAKANESKHVKREVDRAVSKGLYILPFRIEDVSPTGAMEYALSGTQRLDGYHPPVEQHLEKLAHAILALLDDQPTHTKGEATDLITTKTREPRIPTRFLILGAGMIAFVAVMLFLLSQKVGIGDLPLPQTGGTFATQTIDTTQPTSTSPTTIIEPLPRKEIRVRSKEYAQTYADDKTNSTPDVTVDVGWTGTVMRKSQTSSRWLVKWDQAKAESWISEDFLVEIPASN